MAGRSFAEKNKLISINTLNKNGQLDVHSIWLSEIANTASSVGESMCNSRVAYSENQMIR